ncbi:MAG: penicillin-binding protein 1C [Patescibacteria group bacterium]
MTAFFNPLGVREIRAQAKRSKIWGRLKLPDFKAPKTWLTIGIVALFLFAWVSKDLPTPGRIKRKVNVGSTQILDRNGELVFAFSGEQKRLVIPFSDMPETIRDATIAVEDKDFYKHLGIKPTSILRAAWHNLTNTKSTQGGSTITQQFVKNALLNPKRNLLRKVKEVILSLELEALYSKDKILELYLNEIPYGTNAYGVEAASRTYFGKPAKELTLAESAVLAGLPQAPTYFSPYGSHKDELLRRKNFVLEKMYEQHYIDTAEFDQAKTQEIKFQPRRDSIIAPHFVFYIREQLTKKYGERVVSEGGLKVTTTLDLKMQRIAEDSIEEGAKRLDRFGANNAAAVVLDTKSGQVLAMVGSRDYFNDEIDGQFNVTISNRQPGSAFKPVVYATAMKRNDFNPARVIFDLPTTFGTVSPGGPPYKPDNYDGKNRGPVTVRQALANSLNVPAVKVLALTGLPEVLKTAKDMGITTLNDPNRYGLSLVLGGGEVKLIELTNAWATLLNDGTYSKPVSILKVEDTRSGKVLDEFKRSEQHRALDKQIAYEITNILSDSDARSQVFGFTNLFSVPGHSVAVKTGTTQEFRDAWAVGGSKQVAVGVWSGNSNNKAMKKGADGSTVSIPMWNSILSQILRDWQDEPFVRPDGIQEVTVEKFSNKLPSNASRELTTDIFAAWQVPKDKDDINVTVRVNKATGKLATVLTPSELIEERVVTKIHSERPNNPDWEEPVARWAQENGFIQAEAPSEQDDLYTSERVPIITITKPKNDGQVEGVFEITAEASAHFGVKQVGFAIDNAPIATAVNAPYTTSYNANNLSGGNHILKVTVEDTNSAKISKEITILVVRGSEIPIIGAVQVSAIATSKATVTWTTSKPADGQVDYGATNSLGATSSIQGNHTTEHIIELTNLTPKTTYYFRARSKDSSGSQGISTISSFTTQ